MLLITKIWISIILFFTIVISAGSGWNETVEMVENREYSKILIILFWDIILVLSIGSIIDMWIY